MDKEALHDFVLNKTQKCKILVVGDVMLDKYYYGEVTRISPEAPVPITHVMRTKETLGGSANVAHNLALLECQTSIAGFIGDDYHGRTLLENFTTHGIDYNGIITTDRPTTTKIRVMGGHQQMLRLDFEEDAPIEGHYAERLMHYVEMKLNESLDAVILSDYGKGTLTEHTCQRIIKAAHNHGVPVIVDPKGTVWSKYAGADYITPNIKELNAVLADPIRNEDDKVERACHYVMRKFKLKNVVATRSEKGLSFINNEEAIHIPTKAQDVFDVSGAGDTVIAVFSMGLAGGLSPEVSAYMANVAASVVVAKLGTYAVSRQELLSALKKIKLEKEEEQL